MNDKVIDDRFSYRKHGHWIRLKGSNREGRISYYDLKTKRVYVVWEVMNYTMGGHTFKIKYPVSSDHSPKDLVYTPFEPTPWIDLNKVRQAYT